MDIWNDCVAAAKKKLGKNSSGYGFIQGPVLREAQTAYCTIITANNSR